MKLDIRFSERALEDLWCEAVVGFVFQRTYLTKGVLSGLDGKLGGLLGRLERSGFWTARQGEDLLVASEGRIKAAKVLLSGLGPEAECGADGLYDQVKRVGTVLDRMHLRDFAVHIPMREGGEDAYPAQLEASIRNLVDAHLHGSMESADPVLKVVFSIERFYHVSLEPLGDRLRDRFGRIFDLSVVIEREKRAAIGA